MEIARSLTIPFRYPASVRFLRPLLSQDRLAGGALVLAVTQFGASVAGLLRDRALYRTFPELGITDVYYAAFRPSDLLFQVGVMSAMGTVMVPLLAQYRSRDDQPGMSRLLGGTMGLGAAFFGGLALLLALAMPSLAPFLVQFEGEQLALYVQFARLALLINFLFIFGNAAGQALITVQRYWIYGLTPILYTVGTILGTLFLTPFIGPYGPITGTLLGAVVFVLWRLSGISLAGVRPSLSLWHPDLKEMGVLMLPRMLALGALQGQLLFFDRIASGLSQGAITVNVAARNFQSVVVGVVGIAVAQSAFPLMSAAIARGDRSIFGTYLRKSALLMLAVTIPSAVALALLWRQAAILVSLETAILAFAQTLAIYAVSVPFESLNHLLLRSFYAMKDTRIPAIVSVLSAATSVTVAWLTARQYGPQGLAAGFSAGQVLQTALLGGLIAIRQKQT